MANQLRLGAGLAFEPSFSWDEALKHPWLARKVGTKTVVMICDQDGGEEPDLLSQKRVFLVFRLPSSDPLWAASWIATLSPNGWRVDSRWVAGTIIAEDLRLREENNGIRRLARKMGWGL